MIVYVLKLETENKYKIGFTKRSVDERIKGLQTGCPSSIIPIFEFETNYATKLESYLHRMYSTKKISGEWFDLDESDIEHIKSTCPIFHNNMDSLKKYDNPFFHKI